MQRSRLLVGYHRKDHPRRHTARRSFATRVRAQHIYAQDSTPYTAPRLRLPSTRVVRVPSMLPAPRYARDMDNINTFCKYNRLPSHLSRQLRRYVAETRDVCAQRVRSQTYAKISPGLVVQVHEKQPTPSLAVYSRRGVTPRLRPVSSSLVGSHPSHRLHSDHSPPQPITARVRLHTPGHAQAATDRSRETRERSTCLTQGNAAPHASCTHSAPLPHKVID